MSASHEATLKNFFGGSKLSSKLTLKTKCYHSRDCRDISWSCGQLKQCVTDKYFFFLKIRLWTLIAFRYRNCMLPLQYLSDWYLHGVYFDRISRGKTSQIERLFETNLKSCGYFKCSTALWLLLDLSSKGNSLTIVGWAFQAQVVTWRPK